MEKKILIINPPIILDQNFIDYPYFLTIYTSVIASLFTSKKRRISVIDAFANKNAQFLIQKDKIHFGCTYKQVLQDIKAVKNFTSIVIINSPFLNLIKDNNKIQELITNLKKKFPSIPIILADYCLGGMHYVDYNAEDIRKKYGFDKILQYNSLALLHTRYDEILCSPDKIFQGSIQDLNEIPFPDWSYIDVNSYFIFLRKISNKDCFPFFDVKQNTLPIFTSYGCLYNCSFCTSNIWRNSFYQPISFKKLSDYIDDLIKKFNVEKIVILDDLVNPTKKRFSKLIDLIASKGLKAEFPNGLRADQIPINKLKKLKNIASFLSVSLECANDDIRKEIIHKNISILDIENVANSCHKHQLPFGVHYMVGIPGEDLSSINQTLLLAYELNQKYNVVPLIQYALPFPSTKMWDDCKYAGIQLPSKDLTERDIHDALLESSVIKTKYFSSDELKKIKNNFNQRIAIKDKKKIIVNLTYTCNNNCVFCAVGNRKRIDGNWKKQIEFIKKSRKSGIRYIDIDGGEPTLHKQFLKFINICNSLGYERIVVTTNGRLLSNKKMAKILMKSTISEIIFSIHGSNLDIHEKITNTSGSFTQTINGLQNCISINKQLKNKKNISVNTTLCKYNISNLSSIQKMISSKGIKKWTIHYPTPFGSANSKILPNDEISAKNLRKIIEKKPKGLDLRIINLPYCKLFGFEKYLIYDIKKNERLMYFCDGSCVDLYNYLSKKRVKTEKCKNCIYLINCGGMWLEK